MEEIVKALLSDYGLIGIFVAYFMHNDYIDRRAHRQTLESIRDELTQKEVEITEIKTKVKSLEKEVFKK